MKKMYKQPKSSVEEIMPVSICNVSPGVNHDPQTGQEIE